MRLKFLSFGSGSSGNCYFVGTEKYGILIDAGVGIRTIRKVLKEHDIDFSQIQAVFITHDHADHIKTVGCLGEKYGIPIYATEAIHQGIEKSRYVEEPLYTSRRYIQKEEPVKIQEFSLTAFDVPHDGTDNVGYYIEFGEQRMTIATDVGHITENVAKYLRLSNHLVIEANYDEEMLRHGNYPQHLKKRIFSPTGHLSNRETAEFLSQNFDLHVKNIWLCHLSKDNNHPELAYKTVEMAMAKYGIRIGKDVQLMTLKRTNPSEVFYLESV